MVYRGSSSVLLVILLTVTAVAQKVLSAQAIMAQSKEAVVTIQAGDKLGTGFIVKGLLYTCYHVVSGASEVSYSNASGISGRVSCVVAASPSVDIAVFNVSGALKPNVRFGAFEDLVPKAKRAAPSLEFGDYAGLVVGAKLIVIGSPFGLDETLTEGIASGKRIVGSGVQMLQLSAGVSPGSSGSPVLDETGKVVGMVTSSLESGQELNFALAVSEIKNCGTGGVALALLGTSHIQPEAFWSRDQASKWAAEVNDALKVCKEEFDTLHPNSWTIDGGAGELEDSYRRRIVSNFGLLQKMVESSQDLVVNPMQPRQWYVFSDGLGSIVEELNDLSSLPDKASYHTEIDAVKAERMSTLCTRLIGLLRSGPHVPLIRLLEQIGK